MGVTGEEETYDDNMGEIHSEDDDHDFIVRPVGPSKPRTQGKFTKFVTRVKAFIRRLGACGGWDEGIDYMIV
ncbi:hypothetical protein HDU76_009457 [Blyttiomyces sp. JEL0837]|nr:hypothetical protein HDU76_009457 [Blyttiomyces sp. JEL0837]